MSAPFDGKQFSFKQPDGSTIDVRGWGDQFRARFETLDGFTLVRNPRTRFWEIARVSDDGQRLEPVPDARSAADGGRSQVRTGLRLERAAESESAFKRGHRRWEERREQRRQAARGARAAGPAAAPPRRGTVGDYFGLCLLVDFDDAEATIPPDEVERFCNQPGYSGFGNHGSVYDYFFDNSLGRLRYKNIVTPYYRAKKPKAYYTAENVHYPDRAMELVEETLQHWVAAGFDFSQLTADSEDFVYATNVFYAGEVTQTVSGVGLWPHAWHLENGVQLAPGKVARDYQVTALDQQLELGTFCHENGHMLCEFPDLYDDEKPFKIGREAAGVGVFCLMCRGGTKDPTNPTNVSAYLKRLAGWAGDITELRSGQNVSLRASKNEFAIHAKNATEYFLVENRVQAGRDASLPDAGLAIWHVDETGDNCFELMTPGQHYELSLEQADGLFEFEKATDFTGDDGDLFASRGRFGDSTTPSSKWWDGTSSHLLIDRIAFRPQQASFRCRFLPLGVGPSLMAQASDEGE